LLLDKDVELLADPEASPYIYSTEDAACDVRDAEADANGDEDDGVDETGVDELGVMKELLRGIISKPALEFGESACLYEIEEDDEVRDIPEFIALEGDLYSDLEISIDWD
jgi:hypothetical protein